MVSNKSKSPTFILIVEKFASVVCMGTVIFTDHLMFHQQFKSYFLPPTFFL